MAGMFIGAQQMLGIRSNALQCLEEMEGITVRENIRIVEAISALMGQEIEMANAYQVFSPGGWDDKFYGAEQTNICLRNLKQIFGDCTAWQLDIFYREGWGNEKAFHVDRPCTLTCCCCCRPQANMTTAEDELIGSIRDPWDPCCGLNFDINDADGNTVYTINSGCCPLGFYCPFPCCSALRDIRMTIVDTESGEEVGFLTKRVPGMLKFLFAPDVDDYHVEWPGVPNPEHRALIMAAAMFIDFRYFNDNSNDEEPREKARDSMFGGGDSESSAE